MSLEDVKRRFVDEIKLRGYDDKYIDKTEEKEILQIAIQQGISIDSARQALAQVCEHQNYVLESSVLKKIKDDVEAAMVNDGKVDQREFEMILASAKKAFAGKRNDTQVKKQIVEIMEENSLNKVKTGWFSNWYVSLKKELGMS